METAPDIVALNESIKNESAFIDLLQSELSKVIVGQKGMVEGLLIGLLADGHILLEGVPGLAKTLAINSLSKTIGASFSRCAGNAGTVRRSRRSCDWRCGYRRSGNRR